MDCIEGVGKIVGETIEACVFIGGICINYGDHIRACVCIEGVFVGPYIRTFWRQLVRYDTLLRLVGRYMCTPWHAGADRTSILQKHAIYTWHSTTH